MSHLHSTFPAAGVMSPEGGICAICHRNCYAGGPQWRVILSPKGHLALPGDILVITTGDMFATGI